MLIWMKWIDREARRVRVKSIILLGHRKQQWQWSEWLRREAMKSFIPALVIIPIHLFVFTLPNLLSALIIASCLARAVFVLAHAGAVAFRLNKRREAFFGCGWLRSDDIFCLVGQERLEGQSFWRHSARFPHDPPPQGLAATMSDTHPQRTTRVSAEGSVSHQRSICSDSSSASSTSMPR